MKPTAHAAGKGADWWGHVKFEIFSASLNTSTKHTHYDQKKLWSVLGRTDGGPLRVGKHKRPFWIKLISLSALFVCCCWIIC